MISQIEFLCGSIEKGKDGVGDYSRLLASKLQEHHIASTIHEYKIWKDNLRTEDNKNSLYSWQFVPYAYHPKGIVWPAVRPVLPELQKARVHVMLHELWIGGVKNSKLKNKIIGYFQKRSIKKMLRIINPVLITTSNPFHQASLKELGFDSEVLPIYSNIPKGNSDSTSPIWSELSTDLVANRKEYFIVTLFGKTNLYDTVEADMKKVIDKLNGQSKRIIVAHIGKCNNASALLRSIERKFSCKTHVFGMRTETEVADVLAQSDIGLSTYPKILYQKSGTIAAMLYNKLPVVLIRDSFVKDMRAVEFVKEIDEIEDVIQYAGLRVHNSDEYGVDAATQKYLTLLKKYIK